MAIIIRPEGPTDHAAIRATHEAAFPSSAEADLVDALREAGDATVSLVALIDEEVVGHIIFSPVRIERTGATRASVGLGLAPMAVVPTHQRTGIGSQLVRAGLDACRATGHACIVVLGHPDYYPRFGFEPASRFGLHSTYDVPDEVFMAQALTPKALDGGSGVVHYAPAFAAL